MKTITANDGKTYYLPQNPMWRTGFPDKPGWYPTCVIADSMSLRFFNGKKWSYGVHPRYSEIKAARITAYTRKCLQDNILWTDPWWTPSAQEAIKKGKL